MREIAMDSNIEVKETDKNVLGDFFSKQEESIELKIGMTANGEDEAFDMYNMYAYCKGFGVRKDEKHYKNGTKELIRRSFVCSREGFKEFSDPNQEKKYDGLDTRCGCRARVVFKVENGIYEISQIISEHNHPLIEPSQRHLIRSARKLPKVAKEGSIMERHVKALQDNDNNSGKTLRFNRLMRKAFTLMNLAANTDATSEIAERNMDNTLKEIKRYNASFTGGYSDEDDNQVSVLVSDILVKDPPRLRQKGQSYVRIKGALEKKRRIVRNVGTGKSQPSHIAMTGTTMQLTNLGSSTTPVIDSKSAFTNIPFTSMAQSTFSMAHLSQGSSNNVIDSKRQ